MGRSVPLTMFITSTNNFFSSYIFSSIAGSRVFFSVKLHLHGSAWSNWGKGQYRDHTWFMILLADSSALALRERSYIGRKIHNDGMPLRPFSVYECVVGLDLHIRIAADF